MPYQLDHTPHIDWLTERLVVERRYDDELDHHDYLQQLIDDFTWYHPTEPQACNFLRRELVAKAPQLALQIGPPHRETVGKIKEGKQGTVHIDYQGDFFRIDELNPQLHPLDIIASIHDEALDHFKVQHVTIPRVDLSVFVPITDAPIAQQLEHAGKDIESRFPETVYGTCAAWHADEIGPTYAVGIRGTDATKMRKRSPYARIYHRNGDGHFKIELEFKRLPSDLGSANAQFAWAREEACRILAPYLNADPHQLTLTERPTKRAANAEETYSRIAGMFIKFMLRHDRELLRHHHKALTTLRNALGSSPTTKDAEFQEALDNQRKSLSAGVALESTKPRTRRAK